MGDSLCFSINKRQYNGLVQLMKEASVAYPTHEYKDIVTTLMSSTVFDGDMCDVSLPVGEFQPVFWYLLNTCLAVFKTKPENDWFSVLNQQNKVSQKTKDQHIAWVYSKCVELLRQNQGLTRQALIEQLGVSPYTNEKVRESEISLRTWRNEARNN